MQLLENKENEQRKLEEYLLAFWLLASQHKHQIAISKNQFIELLRLAFMVEIPVFKNEWRSQNFGQYADEEDSYFAFEETILEQIVDLREMDETGLLLNEMRYFGIDSPRGNRWFNFDPITYLECAVAGLYDNSEQEAEDSQDTISDDKSPNLQNLTQNYQISWRQIKEFFWCGQIYE